MRMDSELGGNFEGSQLEGGRARLCQSVRLLESAFQQPHALAQAGTAAFQLRTLKVAAEFRIHAHRAEISSRFAAGHYTLLQRVLHTMLHTASLCNALHMCNTALQRV